MKSRISTSRSSSPRATSASISGVGVVHLPGTNSRSPDLTTCTAVVVSHHVVMLHLRRLLAPLCLDKRAEAGDGPAHDERIHFAGAFIGVNRLGIGHKAPHLVVEQDAVASQQFAR